MLCRIPSLETRCLQRSEKWMTQPMVAFSDEQHRDGGACYYSRGPETAIVDGAEIWLGDAGLIVLNVTDALPEVSEWFATIAHEWRHCWQEQVGIGFDGPTFGDMSYDSYKASIRGYFRGSKSESDALWFQWKKTHSPLSEYWISLLTEGTLQ